jgi:DNA-binding response OmpR family regulator
MNVLVIQDDPATGESLYNEIILAKHSCVWVKEAQQGLAVAGKQKDDAIVLGLGAAEAGLALLELIRGAGIRTPVFALTRDAVEERIAALKAGADDCMAKPIATVELLARLQAVCRRTLDRPPTVLQAGKLTLDLTNRRINHGDQEIELTPMEFNVVELLFRCPGKIVSRKMLTEHIGRWGSDRSRNAIDVHINRVRIKLRDVQGAAIATVWGKGYVLRSNWHKSVRTVESGAKGV